MAKHKFPKPAAEPAAGSRFRVYVWVSVLNLAVFAFLAPLFVGRIHHHWVVPVFCGILFLQAWVISRFRSPWVPYGMEAVAAWILLVGAVLFWRQPYMIQCVKNCEFRLAGGLFFLSYAFEVLNMNPLVTPRRKVMFSVLRVFFLVWMLAAFAVRPLRGHLKFLPPMS
jgi:hypothetical protein